MTWIYVNANGNYLVAGFIPHMMANLLFSAHVVTNVKIEALVFIVIVAVILAVSGPNLKRLSVRAAKGGRNLKVRCANAGHARHRY